MQRALVFGLILALGFGMPACGDKGASDDSRSGGGGGSSASTATGAKSPEELLDRMEKFGTSEVFSFGEMVKLVHPDQQKATAFVMGVFPLIMKAMMAAFGAKEGDDSTPDGVKEIEALLRKHGLEEVMKEPAAGKEEEESDLTDEEKLQKFNEIMKDVDHIAFMEEAWQLMMSSGEGKTSSSFDAEAFAAARKTLKVEGDRATMQSPMGQQAPMVLVKASDGLWYIDSLQSELMKQGP